MQKSNVSSVQIVDRRSLTELLSQLKNRLDAQAAALSKEIEDIMLRIDTLMGVRKDGTVIDVSAAIDTFNDIKDFLEGIEGTTLSSLLDQIRSNMPHPDWNENSPNSPNYIANRTHYEDGGPGIVYEEFEGAENTSHSFTTYYYTANAAAQHGLVAGKRYHVAIYREGMERIAGYYTAMSYLNGAVALSNA